MLRSMRTSIELSDGLVERARRLAKQKGVTLRAVVEEALDRLLRESEASAQFRLEAVTFGDGGLCEGVAEGDGDWERIRDLAHLEHATRDGTRSPRSADLAEQDEATAAAAREGRRS